MKKYILVFLPLTFALKAHAVFGSFEVSPTLQSAQANSNEIRIDGKSFMMSPTWDTLFSCSDDKGAKYVALISNDTAEPKGFLGTQQVRFNLNIKAANSTNFQEVQVIGRSRSIEKYTRSGPDASGNHLSAPGAILYYNYGDGFARLSMTGAFSAGHIGTAKSLTNFEAFELTGDPNFDSLKPLNCQFSKYRRFSAK